MSTFARMVVVLAPLIGLLSLAGCSHPPGICIEDLGDCVGGVLEDVCPTDEEGFEWREYPEGDEDSRNVCVSLGYTNNIMGERYRRPRAE